MSSNDLVLFSGIKPIRSIQKAVQKQLEKWVDRKKGLLSLHKESWYQVRFEQERPAQSCLCSLRIQIGTCKWEGTAVGKSVPEALSRALKNPMLTFVHQEAHVQYYSPAAITSDVA
jgi:hypothetical protein